MVSTLKKPKNRLKTQEHQSQLAATPLPDPQPGKQKQFYDSDADILFFGGSAGSGKSLGLLLDFAKPEFLKNSLYRAVIFRRTYSEITNPGSILQESQEIYHSINGMLRHNPLEWTFPSGAQISFRHLQHEKTVYEYQGAQFTRLGIDELCHFSETQFFYLLSRCRSMSGIKPVVRATMNPDADSWVSSFIKWWIDQDTGYPIEERGGVIRYFIRLDGQIIWGDTADELKERYGDVFPKSFTFIPATIFDNQKLLEKDPSYLDNLNALHPVEKERLLKGNWKIRYETSLVFDRNWFRIIDSLPDKCDRQVRFWDMAATAKEVAGKDACYTAGVRLGRVGNDFYVIDVKIAQKRAGDVELMIRSVAILDGQDVKVRFEIEGGSSGLIVEEKLKSDIYKEHPSFSVKGVKPMGDKLTRAIPVAQTAAQGKVYILRDVWNLFFLNACENFDGSPKSSPPTNDIVDALSGAYNALVSEVDYGTPTGGANVKKGDVRHSTGRSQTTLSARKPLRYR